MHSRLNTFWCPLQNKVWAPFTKKIIGHKRLKSKIETRRSLHTTHGVKVLLTQNTDSTRKITLFISAVLSPVSTVQFSR